MIGVFGGTFDPIHFGHLRPVLDVMQALSLREVRFVPAAIPPHRPQPVASGPQRLAMTRLAVAGQPGFVVDDREFKRDAPSWTLDTLRSLHDEVDEPLCLLLGMDAFQDLPTWHEWRSLAEYAHFVVMQRPGSAPPAVAEELAGWLAGRVLDDPDELAQRPSGGVIYQGVSQLDISATGIRRIIAARQSARFLLPDSVVDWIDEQKLYR